MGYLEWVVPSQSRMVLADVAGFLPWTGQLRRMSVAGSGSPPLHNPPRFGPEPAFRDSAPRSRCVRAWGSFNQLTASEEAHVLGNRLRGIEESRI